MRVVNLDNDNVFETEITVQEVRDFFDKEDATWPEDIMTVFDEAQGKVFSGDTFSWIVIKVVK